MIFFIASFAVFYSTITFSATNVFSISLTIITASKWTQVIVVISCSWSLVIEQEQFCAKKSSRVNEGEWCYIVIICHCPVLAYISLSRHISTSLTHNWQKWKRVFLKFPCHKIYMDEAVGLKSCKYTWKIMIFVKMWNLGQYHENLIFCQ